MYSMQRILLSLKCNQVDFRINNSDSFTRETAWVPKRSSPACQIQIQVKASSLSHSQISCRQEADHSRLSGLRLLWQPPSFKSVGGSHSHDGINEHGFFGLSSESLQPTVGNRGYYFIYIRAFQATEGMPNSNWWIRKVEYALLAAVMVRPSLLARNLCT